MNLFGSSAPFKSWARLVFTKALRPTSQHIKVLDAALGGLEGLCNRAVTNAHSALFRISIYDHCTTMSQCISIPPTPKIGSVSLPDPDSPDFGDGRAKRGRLSSLIAKVKGRSTTPAPSPVTKYEHPSLGPSQRPRSSSMTHKPREDLKYRASNAVAPRFSEPTPSSSKSHHRQVSAPQSTPWAVPNAHPRPHDIGKHQGPNTPKYMQAIVKSVPLKEESVSLSWPLVPMSERRHLPHPLLYYDVAFDPQDDMNLKDNRHILFLALPKADRELPVSTHCQITEMVIDCPLVGALVVERPEGLRCIDVFYAIYNKYQKKPRRHELPSNLEMHKYIPAFEQRCLDAPGITEYNRTRVGFLRADLLRVDNCIEWFTKLPPGFTHELPQHLAQQNPPLHLHPTTGVPVLNFDEFCCGAHGFSALIETQIAGEAAQLTLFDTGPDSQSLVRNLKAMQIPVDQIARVITSHWHSDHTGGLLSFLKYAKGSNCVVDCHPNRPISRGMARGPLYDTVFAALPDDPTFEQIAAAGGLVEKHAEGHAVAGGGVWISGEIPRVTPFEGGIPGGKRWVAEDGGRWISDELILDERYAVIDVAGKGLVVFSACSHAGIVNVVQDAVKTFQRPVYMVIGGLHLAPPDARERIAPTVDFLANKLIPAPTYILPMHCSGFEAKVKLEAALGEGCVPAGVGLRCVAIKAQVLPDEVETKEREDGASKKYVHVLSGPTLYPAYHITTEAQSVGCV
ncbi:Metallo-beta-lactamase protein [Mycena indigotica]|uniref:Metallo-beta-lactamase protein n=1 Tax=Mycena indigotica TaxID=2126181 RepID=A0A8H6TB69_9AGAR|nr:Metallo-beta-lactamase protein [Mycena indigotica]KAF7315560.1 Metallo-beta-lactamase protein [Mycena indigotica]